MKFYKYIIPFVLVALAIGLIYNKYSKIADQSINIQQDEARINTKLTIEFDESNTKSFEVKASETDTAFSILKTVAEKEGIILETVQYDFGIFVKKIGDNESTAEKSWIYYINDESGSIAADQYKLKEGDKVTWKYETPKPY